MGTSRFLIAQASLRRLSDIAVTQRGKVVIPAPEQRVVVSPDEKYLISNRDEYSISVCELGSAPQ